MSDKKEATYTALFDILRTLCPEWAPKKVHADFEVAATNAIKHFFPRIEIKNIIISLAIVSGERARLLVLIQNSIDALWRCVLLFRFYQRIKLWMAGVMFSRRQRSSMTLN